MRIIAGEYRGRSLKTTTGPGYRPAMGKVREALFSMLESKGTAWEDTLVLDLFAGSGSLGFEALSRGARGAMFVESAPNAVRVIRENTKLLHIEEGRVAVVENEAGKALGRPPAEPFSLVFIDPPYKLNLLERCLTLLVKNNWLADGAIVNAEVEARLVFHPERLPETITTALELETDRAYGQTRVLLWKSKV